MGSFDPQIQWKEVAIGVCFEPTIFDQKGNTKGHDTEVCLFLDSLLGPVGFSSKLQATPLLLASLTEEDVSELGSKASREGSILLPKEMVG